MALADKTSTKEPTDFSPGQIPELPRINQQLLDVPGFQEQDVAWHEWWDTVKTQIIITEQDTGISLRRGQISIIEEAHARETADGFLEGKYTLTVQAGDVVTGMEITSSTGPNAGTVSQVSFRADKFMIWSGTTSKVMFVADGVQDKVRMANVLTVDGTAGAVYVKTTAGVGAYNNATTPWWVDSTGRMSLKDKLTWDGTTLTITGTIVSTAGTIGGWNINSTTISKNNAVLDSAGQLILGTTTDVIYLSATDPTYRMWAGDTVAATATFSVDKDGKLFSSSGTIGGFTIGPAYLEATNIHLESTGSFTLGATSGAQQNTMNSTSIHISNAAGTNVIVAIENDGSNNGFLDLRNNSGVAQITCAGATGNLTITGTFSGSGSSITSISATNISSGTLNNSRLPSAISVSSVVASGEIRGATARFGTFTALGAEVLTGYISFTDAGGTTRKLGVIA